MGYEILSNDLFQERDSIDRKRRRERIRDEDDSRRDDRPEKESNLIPLLIHLTLILVGVILVGYLFYTIFFGEDVEKQKELRILGGLADFEHKYKGDLNLRANKFEIQSKNWNLNDGNEEITINNFDGVIELENKTIVISGKANNIKYGENSITLNGDNFRLLSENKVEFDIYFSNLTLNVSRASIVFAETLNYQFDSSYIELFDFNSTIVYDGTFSINGYPKEFNLLSIQDGIFISYIE